MTFYVLNNIMHTTLLLQFAGPEILLHPDFVVQAVLDCSQDVLSQNQVYRHLSIVGLTVSGDVVFWKLQDPCIYILHVPDRRSYAFLIVLTHVFSLHQERLLFLSFVTIFAVFVLILVRVGQIRAYAWRLYELLINQPRLNL